MRIGHVVRIGGLRVSLFAIVRMIQSGTRAIKCIIAQVEWNSLRNRLDRIVAEMESAKSPKPTQEMCRLLVAGEDHRFHHHPGVDPFALCRAIWKTVFCDSRQGGSTIAMQFVRTLTGRREWSWKRKLLEIILAVRLTHYIGRDRLPALYLWVGYYGWGMHNFNQACSRARVDPLSASQLDSAMLVARLKYPESRTMQREQMLRIQCRAAHLMSLRTSMEEDRLWKNSAFQIR